MVGRFLLNFSLGALFFILFRQALRDLFVGNECDRQQAGWACNHKTKGRCNQFKEESK